jgi:H+-transporting ATPase
MCGLGWLVSSIPWTLVAAVWACNLVWMFILGGIRLVTERFANCRTSRHAKSVEVVNQPLQPHVPPFAGESIVRA